MDRQSLGVDSRIIGGMEWNSRLQRLINRREENANLSNHLSLTSLLVMYLAGN